MKIENFNKLEVEIEFDEIVEQHARELSTHIKSASSVAFGNGDYANSWTYGIRKDRKGKYCVVYNAEHYRLTHLLEHGHYIANQYVHKTKRTAAKPIIKQEYDKVKDKYVDDMKKAKLVARVK